MFQDSLMESGGQISTRSRYYSIVGVAINSAVLVPLILWPLLHPLALPKQALTMLLVAPAPPVSPRPVSSTPIKRAASLAAARPTALSLQILAPSKIPTQISRIEEASPSGESTTGMENLPGGTSGTAIGDIFRDGAFTVRPVAAAAVQKKKAAISSGVMAGNKIAGSNPTYPAIAWAGRIQGTVTFAATISKTGSIENLRVTSGPPMLAAGALDAVKTWRYKPYLLNGEPVEVETTINVVFNLGN